MRVSIVFFAILIRHEVIGFVFRQSIPHARRELIELHSNNELSSHACARAPRAAGWQRAQARRQQRGAKVSLELQGCTTTCIQSVRSDHDFGPSVDLIT